MLSLSSFTGLEQGEERILSIHFHYILNFLHFPFFSDSEVVKMPSILLNWLKRLTPHPVSRFIQLLSDRLMQPTSYGILEGCHNSFVPFTAGPGSAFGGGGGGGVGGVLQQSPQLNAAGSGGTMTNLRAIAILPTSPDINTEAFTMELQHAMSVFGSTIRLTSGE